MGMGRGSSLLRGEYYNRYYTLNKEKLRRNYLEKKQKKIDNEKLYEAYGGEEKYYRDKLIEAGMIKIILTN
jgi:hypothetical protein|tara:strand:- start:1641 stop:1853 length:213 start_codon:yes stop_codon:yes gene_type:complete